MKLNEVKNIIENCMKSAFTNNVILEVSYIKIYEDHPLNISFDLTIKDGALLQIAVTEFLRDVKNELANIGINTLNLFWAMNYDRPNTISFIA